MLITEGVVLQPDIANMMPLSTYLLHLTSVGDRHTYSVYVTAWKVTQFIAIVTAYAQEDFVEGARLTNELRSHE